MRSNLQYTGAIGVDKLLFEFVLERKGCSAIVNGLSRSKVQSGNLLSSIQVSS